MELVADPRQPQLNPQRYNAANGKLAASLRWLIGRVYENQIPDKLRDAFFYDEEENLHLTPAVATALTNGSLYCQAGARIFQDQTLINQSHSGVLRALSNNELTALDADGQPITEAILLSADPFHLEEHLFLIDQLMAAHMTSIVSIERTVQAVAVYTSVDQREEPLDCIDALLFWVNKICLLVRDDVEQQKTMLKGNSEHGEAIIPEMEDLYEDMCDGACICALVSFYYPDMLPLQDIFFNDPSTLAGCRYNLELLQRFCHECLQWNPFHFEIDDLLFLHESLQPNVNAFLADLFNFFEPLPPPPVPTPPTPQHRRFVPVQGIPDLRTHNVASRPQHPPKVKYPQGPPRSMSMASTDSLMTIRTNDSLKYRPAQSQNFLQNSETTSFGVLPSSSRPSNVESYEQEHYSRTDSLPQAALRLAMDEKRREYDKKKHMESAMSNDERMKVGKDAFFQLMSKGNHREQTDPSSVRSRTFSELGSAREPLTGNSFEMSPQNADESQRISDLSEMVRSLQQQVQQLSMSTVHLAQGSQPNIPHAVSHQAINQHQDPYASTQTLRQPQSLYATLPNQRTPVRSMTMDQSHTYAQPTTNGNYENYSEEVYYQPQQQQQPFQLHQQHAQPPQPAQSAYDTPETQGSSTFRLHQSDASSSRLDPPLELNRNLTNWGMTIKAGHASRPQRRTWENTTFVKPSNELVNEPEVVPRVPSEFQLSQQQQSFYEAPSQPTTPKPVMHQQSPPKDPISSDKPRPEEGLPPIPPSSQATPSQMNGSAPSTNGRNNSFVVDDITPMKVRESSEMTAEMNAKRQAFLANAMKRKEKMSVKNEEMEMKNAEKRAAEIRKQEEAEQRKLEKELKRQQVFENYQKKKRENELRENGAFPATRSASTVGTSSSSNTLNRGHSQPPYGRPRSQVEESKSRTLQRGAGNRPQSTVEEQQKIFVASIAEPSYKLFAKPVAKSNRSLIMNALTYSVFPGAVSNDKRNTVQASLAQSDSKHFLVLFRDHKCQYRGLYTWDQTSDVVHRIAGMGPKICREDMMNLLFKYDSGAKSFSSIPSMKHLSATIDGFTIQDQFWQKPKIPHSGAPTR
ncbi:hypothetical protein L596_014164 [Steinernema carpocapsae]|uniref:CKK domain-containing protein n=1 Tax=Steinernema carpocapsae TaxID=34508 RepID=A0A4U5NB87_STECR|nr:hypothetical protein L596_014164 [Steinernema carpocapsae]